MKAILNEYKKDEDIKSTCEEQRLQEGHHHEDEDANHLVV